ncbi:MAG TPA: hypothetical protein VEK33_04405 [Terriglobales bacterium]|nr:hypothetical protein [Terriglobales bacterium]
MAGTGFAPRRRFLASLAALGMSALVCVAAKHFVMPTAHPARSYPARDEHSNEGVTVALDPYDTGDKASIFTVHYSEVGFLPIFVVVSNDGDQPVSLAASKTELVTHDHSKISPATPDDIYRRIARPISTVAPNPLPWPRKPKGSVSKEVQEEVENSQFAARAIEPHSAQSGFMFFDVAGIDAPLAGAHFYLTGVRDSKGGELMYFDVALENYLSAPSPPR